MIKSNLKVKKKEKNKSTSVRPVAGVTLTVMLSSYCPLGFGTWPLTETVPPLEKRDPATCTDILKNVCTESHMLTRL
jgi:hypothetical protein